MTQKKPGPAYARSEAGIGTPSSANIRPFPQNDNRSDLARLGYLHRLADRQAHEVECFDVMCLAAERYRSDPTPDNAVKAHLAARRYGAAR